MITFEDVEQGLQMIISDVAARPDLPSESIEFYENLLSEHKGSREEFIEYVQQNFRSWYKFTKSPPDWYQSEQWQFDEGKPMVYLGYVQVTPDQGYFINPARFFLFWDPDTGETKIVNQTL